MIVAVASAIQLQPSLLCAVPRQGFQCVQHNAARYEGKASLGGAAFITWRRCAALV